MIIYQMKFNIQLFHTTIQHNNQLSTDLQKKIKTFHCNLLTLESIKCRRQNINNYKDYTTKSNYS